jgi:flagellin
MNQAFADAGMNLTASYNNAYSGTNAGIQITANEFGSKHDVKVSLASEVGSGGTGLYLSAGSDNLVRNVIGDYALINSDLTESDGKLLKDTVLISSAAADNLAAVIASGDAADYDNIKITQRDGTETTITAAAGASIDALVTQLNGITDLTALFDEKTGTLKVIDATDPEGTNSFKIENLDSAGDSVGNGLASVLGIYGETTGSEIDGVRISRTKDYVLDITDPNNMSGTLLGNYGDRSTSFEGINSASAVVSSGIDPDRSGPEQMGSGGIAGISFQLEEKQLDETGGQNRFSILATKGSLSFQIGPNEGTDHRISVSVGDMSASSLGISGLDISTQDKAQSLLDSGKLDEAINKVSLQRGALGAVQNRLDHTIKNLSVTKENLQAGESRIRDVDVADETLEFTRNQILSQAGTAMLAQANQIPQSALQLLG